MQGPNVVIYWFSTVQVSAPLTPVLFKGQHIWIHFQYLIFLFIPTFYVCHLSFVLRPFFSFACILPLPLVWKLYTLLKFDKGLLWWLSGKEFAYHCRRHKFNRWSRKIPHAVEQLSPCATTIEPVSIARNYRAHALQLLKPTCPRAHTPQEKPPQ